MDNNLPSPSISIKPKDSTIDSKFGVVVTTPNYLQFFSDVPSYYQFLKDPKNYKDLLLGTVNIGNLIRNSLFINPEFKQLVRDIVSDIEIPSIDTDTIVTIEGEQEVKGRKDFTGGLAVNGQNLIYDPVKKAWQLTGDLVVTGAVTMFGSLSGFTPSTVTDAVLVDGKTIVKTKNSQGQWQLTATGGSGGEGGGLTPDEVNILITNALSPVSKNLETKWTQDDTKITNWDSAFNWGDHSKAGYMKSTDFDTQLKKYILKDTVEQISARHNFTDGLQIAGINIYKSQDKTIYLDANLVVSGAFTMFGTGSTTSPTIWENIPFNPEQMSWDGSQWNISGGGSGSVDDATVRVIVNEVLGGKGYATEQWVGDNYLATSGGTMRGVMVLPANITIDDTNGSTIFGYDSTGLLKVGQTDKNLLLRGATAKFNDNILLHSGNIIEYTAGKANKLSNKVKLWGNEFDGSSDVYNALTSRAGYNALTLSDSFLVLGYDYARNGLDTFIDGGAILFRYGVEQTIGLKIDKDGNVGIGYTTPQAKLHVGGDAKVDGNLTLSGGIISGRVFTFLWDSNKVYIGTKWYNTILRGSILDFVVGDTTAMQISADGNTTINGNLLTAGAITTPQINIGGLAISKSQDDTLFIDGNVVVRGAITMFGTGSKTSPTIWSNIPFNLEQMSWDGSRWNITVEGSSGSVDDARVNVLIGEYLNRAGEEYAKQSWVGDNYLAKRGDTVSGQLYISSANDAKLILNNTDSETKYQAISFRQSGVEYGFLGTFGDDNLNWSGNRVLHSGNIGSYNAGSADVLKKSFANENINYGAGDGLKLIYCHVNPGNFATNYQSGISVLTDYSGWQLTCYGNRITPNPYFRQRDDKGVWGGWNRLAFITDNVASATKLATPRSIWGQGFDGQSDVSGNISVSCPYINVDPQLGSLDSIGASSITYPAGYGLYCWIMNTGNAHLQVGDDSRMGTSLAYDMVLQPLGGNVVIGGTTADERLHVYGNAKVDGRLESEVLSSAYWYSGRKLPNEEFIIGGAGYLGLGESGLLVQTYASQPIIFRTSGSNQMRMLGNGNVAIGDTTANAKLHVHGDVITKNAIHCFGDHGGFSLYSGIRDGEALAIERLSSNGAWVGPGVTLFNNGNVAIGGGSAEAKLHVHGDIKTTSLIADYIMSSNSTTDGYYVGLASSGAPPYKGLLLFTYGGTPISMYTGETMRMAIGAEGDVTIYGNLLATGAITMFSQLSMKNVIDYDGLSLAQLAQIKPARFTWKGIRDNRTHVGGIADEVIQVLPEVVHRTSDDKLTMDYGSAAFYIGTSLIKPVVELWEVKDKQQKEIESLKKRVEHLENENRQLRAS